MAGIVRPLGVLTDGFPTLFGFGFGPDDNIDHTMGVLLCEKRLKPFGMDGGGPNDTTCMRNTRWRTKQSKRLLTLTDMTITVSYNPKVYDKLEPLILTIQVNQLMFFAFPDASVVQFWGFVDAFDPHEITEGAQPEADLKVCPTNQDDTGAEVPPDYAANAWQPQGIGG